MALGDLFAPAYNASNPQSVQAVNDWQNAHFSMTNPLVEQSRTPVGFNTGNPAGMVDVEALRSLAQGGNTGAQRDAIAAQLAARAAAPAPAPAAAAPAGNPQWAAMRAQMSPSDLQTFAQAVGPAQFAAFMGTAAPAAATSVAAPSSAAPAASVAAPQQQPQQQMIMTPIEYYGGGA